jgi:hypothetical protein
VPRSAGTLLRIPELRNADVPVVGPGPSSLKEKGIQDVLHINVIEPGLVENPVNPSPRTSSLSEGEILAQRTPPEILHSLDAPGLRGLRSIQTGETNLKTRVGTIRWIDQKTIPIKNLPDMDPKGFAPEHTYIHEKTPQKRSAEKLPFHFCPNLFVSENPCFSGLVLSGEFHKGTRFMRPDTPPRHP